MIKNLIVILAMTQLISCGQETNSTQRTKNVSPVITSTCLLTQSECKVTTKLGDFEVRFGQSQALLDKNQESSLNKKKDNALKQLLTELPFTIVINEVNDKKKPFQFINISGHLEGRDMFMGKVPVFFEQQSDTKQFIATSLLASCSEDTMFWRLWITVKLTSEQEVEDSEQRFFIDFESLRL